MDEISRFRPDRAGFTPRSRHPRPSNSWDYVLRTALSTDPPSLQLASLQPRVRAESRQHVRRDQRHVPIPPVISGGEYSRRGLSRTNTINVLHFAASQSPWGSVSCLGVTANRCLRRLRDACQRLLFPGECGPPPDPSRNDHHVRDGGGGRAVAGAGGARVRGAAVGTAWRPCVASRSRSLLFARRRRRVRQQGASRGFWAKCSQSAICGRRTPESVLRACHVH